jgi:NitT/TauT family transport system ATP-binding protein
MSFIIDKLSKNFAGLEILTDISFAVDDNRIICLLGPSGCGKTTLLNIFAGLIEPDAGHLHGFADGKLSYLFQEPRLLEWRTVAENIDFVLRDRMPAESRTRLIKKNLELVGLWPYRDFYISQLSGGMKQRVAIARAFAFPAEILLMDEPFKSLDLDLKASLIKSFTSIWSMNKRSVFFVTHDIHAAIILGDEILVLSEKPTRIQKYIKNQVPLRQRNLQNPDILKIERQLYNHFSYFR